MVTSGTIAKSSIASNIGRQQLYRIGKIVFLEIVFNPGSDVVADNYLFMLPDGFRPKNATYAATISAPNTISVEIGTNGNIYNREALSSSKWYTISQVFFTA